MTAFEAALLGLVQGLTEFLPVSSTAHLLVAQAAFGLPKEDLHIEVATHLGTVGAVVVYYRREFGRMIRDFVLGGPERRLALLVILATAMLGLVKVAYMLLPRISEWRLTLHIAAVGLTCMGIFLLCTRFARPRPGVEGGWRHAVLIGVAQAASAVVPGWSRSGSTIGTGLFLGLDPAWAARFSFLLSVPAVLVGTAYELTKKPIGVVEDVAGLGVAGVVAFVSGLLAIHVLLRIVARGRLAWFGPYCIAVGLGVLLVRMLV